MFEDIVEPGKGCNVQMDRLNETMKEQREKRGIRTDKALV